MPNFRFRLPSFLSSDAPSRVTSGAASSAGPPLPPRPPFRPAGVAQPPPKTPPPQKPTQETEPKASPLARSKSSQKGAAASSSASPSSQRMKHTRQNKLPVYPLRKPETATVEEPKKEVESRSSNENGGGNIKGVHGAIKEINPVELKRQSAEAQKQQKKKSEEKLAIQETKKIVHEGIDDATQRMIIRPVAPTMDHVRAARDTLETKAENGQLKAEISEIKGNSDDTKNAKTLNTDPKIRGLSNDSHVNPNVEGSSMSKRIKKDIKEGISKLTWGKTNPNNDEKPVTVVTLTGENKGATMQIASDKAKSDSAVHIRRGYRSNPDESPYTTATDSEEGRSSDTGKHWKEEESLAKTYVNCNSQSINNSIVFDSSVAEHNPGAHVNLRIEEAKKASGSPEKKPETNPPEKNPANAPRVRRRCLRGLLAESSESETENPLKPRRHGCRFSCKGKDNDNGIF